MLAEVQRYVTVKPGFPIELRTREEWCLQGWVKFRKVLKFALVAWMERSGIRGMRAGAPPYEPGIPGLRCATSRLHNHAVATENGGMG